MPLTLTSRVHMKSREPLGTSEPCDAGGQILQKSLQGVWIGGNMCDAAAGEHKHVR